MRVHIPSMLHSYTQGKTPVEADGDDLAAIMHDLDRQFPGLRFRVIDEQDDIREHMRLFINEERAHDLSERVRPGDEVHIIGALSGG